MTTFRLFCLMPGYEPGRGKEDRSPENIRRCYQFLRDVPYQGTEDRERLNRLETVAVAEATMLADDTLRA